MKAAISIAILLAPLGMAHDMPPRSMSTSEFHQAFMEAGIVPDIMGSFDPTVSFYAGYQASDGDKALMMPGSRLKKKEAKFPFEFSVENIGNAVNVTRNSRFIVYMIGPDAPTQNNPTERNMRHFLAGNFTVEQTRSEVLSSAILMKNSTPAFNEYMAPDPKADSGMHRYVYLLYVQPERLNKMGFDSVGIDEKNRKNFNISQFRQQAGLGRPIGGTYFIVNRAQNNNGGNGGNNNGNGRSGASTVNVSSMLTFVTLLAVIFVWI